MNRRLGRRAPRSSVARFVALDLARHLDASAMPAIPPKLDLTDPWPALYLGHNDAIGDCGVAGVANGLSTEARREGRVPAFASRPTINDDIRALYFEYTGGADTGVVLLEFLDWLEARAGGFFGETVGTPIAVNPSDWQQVTTALALGYNLYVGAEITNGAVSSPGGSFWRTDDGRDQTIDGGHCMIASGFIEAGSYGQPNFSLESWAMKFYATRDWWNAHVDEAYILVDLERPSSAFNLDTLRADILALRGAP